MKKLIYKILAFSLFFINISSSANELYRSGVSGNWTTPNTWEIYTNSGTSRTTSQTESASSKGDSLPEGVTQDWFNNLLDENGNRIIPETAPGTSRGIPEDPEGDAMQRKIFNGINVNDQYGFSVSSAGDVNGDGYSDVIVGADGYSTVTGRAYVFFGGASMNNVADVTMTGEAANNYFGISVSSAGDVNGDGYSDVIVGAFAYSSITGKAYIFFGGASMNNVADVTMTGEAIDNYFGESVSTAGDVNGDGYSDVIVGANGYSSFTGRAYVYFGSAVMNNVADVTMTGEAGGNFFGYSVSSAGDVNGDGYSDVIVGAYGYSGTGRAYIFFGSAVMNNVADVTMTGEAASNSFGNSVSEAGDVNGDGYSDVIVGARGYSSNTGRAYVFLGGAGMDIVADVTITGEATENYFGYSVSTAGDVNGDGYSDVIVGARGYSTFTGKAYVFFGEANMNGVADVTMTGEAASDQLGISVSTAGDVNCDGYSDVIVGAWGYSSNTGRAYIYDYFMRNEIISDVTMTGETGSNYFGRSVSSAGDVNGDGYPDVIVGGPGYSSNTGRAYVFFGGGGAGMDNVADVTMTGEAASNFFGQSVSEAGDVNGDGYSDVIVGATAYSSSTGRAYVFFGGAVMNNTADVTMTGEAAGNVFGESVSSAGDVNGDGYSDVVVGARKYSTSTGRAYVFFGGSGMNNVADVTMTGEAGGSQLGTSVSSAGDVNGNGYDEIIVGAIGTSRAFIYFGGTDMNNASDITLTGESVNDNFGISVSSAGDVNGDGYSDVIVGASGYSSSNGRAYVYFGGTSMNNASDVTLTGEAQSNIFGCSVSSAGDVNGDGYSDVIVGAYGYSSFTGRAHIYFGGAGMNNASDVTMTGEAGNIDFGNSVSQAGDVNGDGYSDVIVGANRYSSNTGRTYIFLGSAISAKPILNYVRDVPNDQGGFLNLKFAKSSFDVPLGEIGGISYQIDRSAPPNGNGYQWISVANISGTYESFYITEIHTPQDSGVSGNNTFFFRVTAVSNSTGKFWRSNILSGHSIDNIAPPTVSPFTATATGENVTLNWGNNSAPDFLNYVLFRSVSPVIDPYTETPLTTVTQTSYTDTSPLNGVYYYFIVAQDIHGNYSPVAVTQSPFITLNLTMLIQGFYNSSTDLMVQDTARVFLRNSTAPYAVVDSAKAYLSNAGAGTFSFANSLNGVSYYLQLKHRNSLETWSKTTQTFISNSLTYNFTTANTQAYGNNMINVDASPVRYADFSGDVNQNGTIDLNDILSVYNAASGFSSGYVVNDVNGDNIADLNDILIAYNNSAGFVTVVRP